MVDTTKAVVPYLRQFNEEEKKLIAVLLAEVAPKATDEEKALFLYIAQKKGLDPFDRQLYLVPRWTYDPETKRSVLKHSVQISIDTLRLMAQRSGKYAGQIGPEWCGPDGKWHDVWISEEHPVAARVGILRHDFKEPLYSVALFKSYKQTKKDGTLTTFWDKFDAHMLGKCAEALSIRRGFPEETSGYYIPEEMGNPELVYTVAEVEQDNSAPVAESEIVDDRNATTTPTQQPTPVNPTKPVTNNASTPKTEPTPENKKSLDTSLNGSALMARHAAIEPVTTSGVSINWTALLRYALKNEIADGTYKLSDLLAMKANLPPEICAKITTWLDAYEAAKHKAA